MKKYIEDLVSVVIPTYKRSEMLIRAIDSVLTQTYTNIELILVNDNEPNDEYSELLFNKVKKYESDPRFKLICQKEHINGAVARNIGIKTACGEYIAFLDDDDWWLPTKIEKQVSVLKKLDDSWGGVSCKFQLFNSNGEIIEKTKKYRDGYIYKDILLLLSDVATGTILLRRESFDTTRYFDEKLLRHQDLQLLVEFTSKYKLLEIDEYLHCVDVSDTQNRPNPDSLIKYKKAFFESIDEIMQSLTPRERKAVYALHNFELGYVYLKYGNKKKAIKYCFSIFTNYLSFFYSCKKIIDKIKKKH